MEIEPFCRELLTRLDVDIPLQFNPYAGLHEDLGLDSVQTFEAIIITEVLADCMAPPSDLPALFTLMDAYEYYERCRAATRALFGTG